MRLDARDRLVATHLVAHGDVEPHGAVDAATTRCSIFIASMATMASPASTASPSTANTAVTVPGMGERRSGSAARPPRSVAARRRSAWARRSMRTKAADSPSRCTQTAPSSPTRTTSSPRVGRCGALGLRHDRRGCRADDRAGRAAARVGAAIPDASPWPTARSRSPPAVDAQPVGDLARARIGRAAAARQQRRRRPARSTLGHPVDEPGVEVAGDAPRARRAGAGGRRCSCRRRARRCRRARASSRSSASRAIGAVRDHLGDHRVVVAVISRPSSMPASTRTPSPVGARHASTAPVDGRKPRSGLSA